jgi:hypothetical protein
MRMGTDTVVGAVFAAVSDRPRRRPLIACSDIAPHFRAGNLQPLLLNLRVMSEITMVVSSIDPLAPYKASDDLVLELVSVAAIIKVDPEDAAAAPCRVEICGAAYFDRPSTSGRVSARQSPGSDDLRQKRRRLSGRRDKVQGGSLTCMALVTSGTRNGTSREALVVYSLYDFGS